MDLLVLSEVKWNYLRTRKRFLLTHFPEHTRILFLQPLSFSTANNLLPRREDNVTYVSTPVLKPHTESRLYNRLAELKAFRNFLGVLIVLWVRLVMLFLRVKADVPILISNVYFVPVAEHLRSSFVCYDCNDDPTVFPGVRGWSKEYFGRLCERSDVTVACSESLARRVRSACGGKVVVVGNGVDYELFARDVSRRELPDDIAQLRQAIVGYTGAIKEWFDFQLIAEAAKVNPNASFVLIGPVAPSVRKEAQELAKTVHNVRFLGERAYESLPLYLAPMNVCLIPFKRSALTAVLNPNKLYEYFAAGKTVVSLRYSEDLARYEGLMYLVEERAQFARAVTEALRQPIDPRKVREVASAHSWRSKANEMMNVFDTKGSSGNGAHGIRAENTS